jgi:hypothetical protein
LPPALRTPMYDGLVEAMTNCAQHAYLRGRRDGLGIKGNSEWGIPDSLNLTHGDSVVRDLLTRIGRAARVVPSDAALVAIHHDSRQPI